MWIDLLTYIFTPILKKIMESTWNTKKRGWRAIWVMSTAQFHDITGSMAHILIFWATQCDPVWSRLSYTEISVTAAYRRFNPLPVWQDTYLTAVMSSRWVRYVCEIVRVGGEEYYGNRPTSVACHNAKDTVYLYYHPFETYMVNLFTQSH